MFDDIVSGFPKKSHLHIRQKYRAIEIYFHNEGV